MNRNPGWLGKARFLQSHLPSYILFFSFGGLTVTAQTQWSVVGPDGGDARAFATEPGKPEHLYLGTTNSWIYESNDGGGSWHRLARVGGSPGLVFDHIVIDSANSSVIYAAAWMVNKADGGLWISHNAGKDWDEVKDLHGQSIFAFAQAPSDAKTLFAGTLAGVFRSTDSGTTWAQISPAESHEIHEVESLAVDPDNPEIVYAGTWHLPWKTTDGGKNWHNIKKGLIEDSDVFSIVVDPKNSKIVYLSACSGIYKSETAGELFRKIQGIPSEARRTRVLMQDPTNRNIVYAGTTEGLYKTTDAGRTFKRMTGDDVIVNDVRVDPTNAQHVLLATDRGGVLASTDAAESFTSSNRGYSARKVEALLVDRENPSRLYAGVVNDKEFGGVFASSNGGAEWDRIAGGLDGRDIFSLAQAPDGSIWAGTSHGIFSLQSVAGADAAEAKNPDPVWQPRNTIANTVMKAAVETVKGKRIDIEKSVKEKVREIAGRVSALDLSGEAWLAATSDGLLTSRDKGATWQGGPVMGIDDYLSVTARGKTLVAAQPNGVVISEDAGASWLPMRIPAMLTRIHCVAFSGDGTLWLGAREGVYFSHDKGNAWFWVERLPFRDVDDVEYDAKLNKVLVSSRGSDQVFSIDPKTLNWKFWQTGYPVALIRASGDRLLAASLSDGVVLEPQVSKAETSSR